MPISNEAKIYGYILGEILTAVSTFDQVTVKFSEQSKRNAYSFRLFGQNGEKCSFAVYVKTSSKRISPWRFTFLRDHQQEIENLIASHDEVFLALVNGNDGVACFNYATLKTLLDDYFEDSEWISIRRKTGEQYTVAGKDGKLTGKLPLNEFPSAIIEFVETAFTDGETEQSSQDEQNKPRRKLFGFL